MTKTVRQTARLTVRQTVTQAGRQTATEMVTVRVVTTWPKDASKKSNKT